MNRDITCLELKQVMSQRPIQIIDIRDNYQYQLGKIPTARNIPINFLLTGPENYLNKEETYYIYCEFGNRSKRACQELRELGYKVINVDGGYQEYKQSL